MDLQVDAVRMGWLPFYPQFDENPIELVKRRQEGATRMRKSPSGRSTQLKNRKLRFSVEDPEPPKIGRAFGSSGGPMPLSSAKGHEYFLKHYLGTHDNAIADEVAKGSVEEVVWREPPRTGKMDLVVDLNFRMDTSALYSDVVLPSATWYEKDDLNTTDLHSYIHPLGRPYRLLGIEERLDFEALSEKVSGLGEIHFPDRSGIWWPPHCCTILRMRSPNPR